MVEVLVVVLVVVAAGLAAVAVDFVLMRRAAAQAAVLDAQLRPVEARSGRCGACDGAGTRIEARPGLHGGFAVEVTCYRCGGTGAPLPRGETARLMYPSGWGPLLRRAGHVLAHARARAKSRRHHDVAP